MVDYRKVSNVEIEGINTLDAPDYVDAYISYCEIGGREATSEELDIINNDSQFVYEQVDKYLY